MKNITNLLTCALRGFFAVAELLVLSEITADCANVVSNSSHCQIAVKGATAHALSQFISFYLFICLFILTINRHRYNK